MKTFELTGAALDWAVAKCEGIDLRGDPLIHGKSIGNLVYRPRPDYHEHHWEHWKPSTDWSQGGPIIEKLIEEGRLTFGHGIFGGYVCSLYGEKGQCGPTPLIAAMRCYVASKLGDEVDVPEKLINA